MRRTNGRAIGFLLLAVGLAGATFAPAQTFTERPGPRDFILDQANLIIPEDRAHLHDICDKLLTEKRIPIVVVTIPSLPFDNNDIEAYARALFDDWGIGYEDHNYGILLLVSLGDRKARIELGADYKHTKDADARLIMDDIIIPRFKKRNYSQGILQGVQALDTMARGGTVQAPVPWWKPLLFIGLIGLAIGIAISLIRRGEKGWGYAILAAVFAILAAVCGVLVYMLIMMAADGRSRGGSFGGGGGSFGGGSFGGGRGGGGGATGSW